MSHPSDITEALASLASILREQGIRWYLFGAQAVAVYGIPRLTADIDVTVEFPLDRIQDLVATLTDAGFTPRISGIEAFAQRSRVLPLAHLTTGMPVDLIVAGPGLEEEFLARAREVNVGGIPIPVISIEDLITSKILAGRPKDLEDVRGILRDQGAADLELVRHTLEILQEALDRNDLVTVLDDLARSTDS
ncbi:MAG: nucleotidyl transferase AbiEii/AbiGii toxin family protein [Actinomycetota bacterium]